MDGGEIRKRVRWWIGGRRIGGLVEVGLVDLVEGVRQKGWMSELSNMEQWGWMEEVILEKGCNGGCWIGGGSPTKRLDVE